MDTGQGSTTVATFNQAYVDFLYHAGGIKTAQSFMMTHALYTKRESTPCLSLQSHCIGKRCRTLNRLGHPQTSIHVIGQW